MDIFENYQHHRKAQQGVQAKNQAHGDRGRGEVLLYPPGFYFTENGTALEVKPTGKSAQKPTHLEPIGCIGNLHKKIDTAPR